MMPETSLDHLFPNSVNFLPHYNPVVNGKTHLLIVGESHFKSENPRVDRPVWSRTLLDRGFTREVIDWNRIIPESGFFRQVHSLLHPELGDNFWDKVSFYNYVQFAIEECGLRPSPQMWRESAEPFDAVVNALRPPAILFVSKATWNEFTQHHSIKELGTVLNAKEKPIPVCEASLACGYRFLTTYTFHPSLPNGTPWIWQPVVSNFLKSISSTDERS